MTYTEQELRRHCRVRIKDLKPAERALERQRLREYAAKAGKELRNDQLSVIYAFGATRMSTEKPDSCLQHRAG